MVARSDRFTSSATVATAAEWTARRWSRTRRLLVHIFFDQSEHVFGQSQVLDVVAANVTFGDLPEPLTVLRRASVGDGLAPKARTHPRRADHITQMNVHEVVATDQIAVVRFTIFQFHELANEKRPSPNLRSRSVCLPSDGTPPCEEASMGARRRTKRMTLIGRDFHSPSRNEQNR